jgi:hypothetical protein
MTGSSVVEMASPKLPFEWEGSSIRATGRKVQLDRHPTLKQHNLVACNPYRSRVKPNTNNLKKLRETTRGAADAAADNGRQEPFSALSNHLTAAGRESAAKSWHVSRQMICDDGSTRTRNPS